MPHTLAASALSTRMPRRAQARARAHEALCDGQPERPQSPFGERHRESPWRRRRWGSVGWAIVLSQERRVGAHPSGRLRDPTSRLRPTLRQIRRARRGHATLTCVRADPGRSGRQRLSRRAAALLLLVSLACGGSGRSAELPDYARGRVEIAPPSKALADLLPYRTLTRDDFRADAPPLVLPHDAPPHGAMTCARIMPQAKLATRSSSGAQELRLLDLGFAAAMDRSCSHWSATSPLPEAYVLEHEQIHFAIVEREAQRLNARADALSKELVYRGAGIGPAHRRAGPRVRRGRLHEVRARGPAGLARAHEPGAGGVPAERGALITWGQCTSASCSTSPARRPW